MSWTKVLPLDSLAPGTRQVVKVGKRNILLLNEEGKLYAVDNVCPHAKLPLKKGKITPDGSIVCPWHRSAFDLCSGEVKDWIPWPPVVGKAMGLIAKPKPLPIFPVRIEEGSIWVDVTEE
jgi:nitrite reductase/ring-hydroxylating ferredoxin subunit